MTATRAGEGSRNAGCLRPAPVLPGGRAGGHRGSGLGVASSFGGTPISLTLCRVTDSRCELPTARPVRMKGSGPASTAPVISEPL